MYNLTNIDTVKSILNRHNFKFSKSLGQNFIINPAVCPEMVELSGIDENCGVIEIGPGIGVLTQEIAKRAKKVVCIELDSRLLPILEDTLADFDNIEIINEDVMKADLKGLIEEKFKGMKVHICANLPYYITSPIIMMLLESELTVEAITVMVQKEAADRLCAEVGSRDAGAVTVAVNFYARAKKLFEVKANSFMPAPKVDSAVIKLEIRQEPEIRVKNKKFFFDLVRAAFGQRRKTAVNSISTGLGIPKEKVANALVNCGFDVNVRGETFTMQDFANLAKELES